MKTNFIYKEAVFFDIDGTLVHGNTQLGFLIFLRKKSIISLWQFILIVLQYVLFLLKLNPNLLYVFNYAYSPLQGKTIIELNELIDEFIQHTDFLHKQVYPEAIAIIREHQKAGRKVLLLTTSIEPLAQAIATQIGVDTVLGTHLEINNNIYTGNIDGELISGSKKVYAANIFLQENQISWNHTWAYADNISDKPILKHVKYPFAVNPHKILRKYAKSAKWNVLMFK